MRLHATRACACNKSVCLQQERVHVTSACACNKCVCMQQEQALTRTAQPVACPLACPPPFVCLRMCCGMQNETDGLATDDEAERRLRRAEHIARALVDAVARQRALHEQLRNARNEAAKHRLEGELLKVSVWGHAVCEGDALVAQGELHEVSACAHAVCEGDALVAQGELHEVSACAHAVCEGDALVAQGELHEVSACAHAVCEGGAVVAQGELPKHVRTRCVAMMMVLLHPGWRAIPTDCPPVLWHVFCTVLALCFVLCGLIKPCARGKLYV